MSEAVRWTIKVSRQTDLALRTFLGSRGMKKGDLSKFVEDAVRWRVLDQAVRGIGIRNQDLPAARLEKAVAQAVCEVRGKKPRRRR